LSFQISLKCGLCESPGWQKKKKGTDQADLRASQEKKKEVGVPHRHTQTYYRQRSMGQPNQLVYIMVIISLHCSDYDLLLRNTAWAAKAKAK